MTIENSTGAASPPPAASINSDLVEIPPALRHDSGRHVSLFGVLVALLTAILGGVALGAGYGAFQALCGEHLANITLFCAIPFWLHAPAQIGYYLGNVRESRWQLRIEIVGLAVCLYAVQVGWLLAVLDGPGLVLNPVELIGHVFDSTNHGIWVEAVPLIDLKPEIQNLKPFLIALRIVEFSWLLFVGVFSLGSEAAFPYCQICNRWMSDAESVRLRYEAVDAEEVRELANELVQGDYAALTTLTDAVKPKEKGLAVDVFSCPKCRQAHALDVRWYRANPDPDQTPTEQLIDSAAGVSVVSRLKVTGEVPAHVAEIAGRKAA